MAGPPGLNRAGRATILDVAAAAGVSRQTVTRAMNGMAGISAATKERVLAAAEALGYRPSRFGRGLVLGGERQLGLVVDDLRNPYSPELAAAVVRAAGAHGWTVMLADVALAADADRSVVSLGEQTDAVVGYLGERAAEWVGLLGSVPVVELDPAGPVPWGAVHLDPSAAVEELAQHLVDVGVRRPVVLDTAGGPSRRAVLLRAALAARGVDAALSHAAASTAAAAGAVVAGLLDAGEQPDAVLAFNDVMALGVLAACRRAGLDVPGDVRVTGVDGLPLGALLAPTLTTLAVDFAAVAESALELAADDPTGSRTVAHHLLLRESA
ncbi:LacI family DNA-binding transcriptional regulator [Amnibacterium kyonggiense]|uniref:LacI family transcriptional regulator n=1 Tax=Amnibacterium kyonggiense TaxID=595671 RepID=A0A4R7FSI8_9MICO|nr:LacI family DNA-binding transcriptional regulator [Amnibacterium kyonggiense]TDS80832.1 LacI family transcriptional regulator [Amnibacterium kyonggiense]